MLCPEMPGPSSRLPLQDILGACERILRAPIPLSYTRCGHVGWRLGGGGCSAGCPLRRMGNSGGRISEAGPRWAL